MKFFRLSPTPTICVRQKLKISNMPKRRRSNKKHLEDPPNKRRKVKSNEISKKFSNERDQKSFEKLFKAVNKSQIIKQLKIPSDISMEIAYLAVGKTVLCESKWCQNQVIILEQDKEDGIKSNNNFYKFAGRCNWNDDDGVYFCSKCMIDLEKCGCNRWTLINEDTVKYCYFCDEKVMECIFRDCQYGGIYLCNFGSCSKESCYDCNYSCTSCCGDYCVNCWSVHAQTYCE